MPRGGAVKRAAAMTKQDRMARERALLTNAVAAKEEGTASPADVSSSHQPGPSSQSDYIRVHQLEESLREKEAHISKLKLQVQDQQRDITNMIMGGKAPVAQCEGCKARNKDLADLQNDFLQNQLTLEAQIKKLEMEAYHHRNSSSESLAAASSRDTKIDALEGEVATLTERGEKNKQIVKVLRDTHDSQPARAGVLATRTLSSL